jgi:CheY-like chemotaxis protein
MSEQSGYILLVEDSDEDTELIMHALRGASSTLPVARVRDGVQALEFLRCLGKWSARSAGAPVLVLLDNQMPRLDGTEVLREIRADAALKDIPVVMLTSSSAHMDILKSHHLGATGYVVKPLTIESFAAAARACGLSWPLAGRPPGATP